MNKYTELSDFEINKRVAIFIGFSCYYGDGSYTNGLGSSAAIVKGKNYHGYFRLGEFAPCNNPADAMPIIIENEISMIKSSGGWMCCHGSVGHVYHESLYRGAMEVFLMIKDAVNEKV
ncbi:phage protein NinX family protein [Proteus penneri]|uniref:phage protein NinX family protein n=1 Tax=Proteus penneri TaxID=102862 RepID=UPI002889F41D|nr:phage protein NinX family protein [Proteus penneri]